MKKITMIFLAIISLVLIPLNTMAASGSIGVTSSSTAVVGNKITVTVTLSSSTSIGSWQMDLNYDKAYLQLTGSTAEGGGTRMVNSSATGTKKKSYTFTFKALKSGSTRVSVSSYLAYAYTDISEMSLTSGSKTIKIMTQQELEASYSKDNTLKDLSVEGYQLDKEFNKDTLEYTIIVPTGTTSVKVTATKNDSTASVSGDGEVDVTEGLNTIPIVVTAQNGDQKTYNLIVNVEDQNPINVKVDNDDYVVVKNSSQLTAPPTFSENKTTINNIEVPSFINDATGITLVGLKDSTGNIGLYIYENNVYTKYKEMKLNNLLLIPVAFDKELDFTKTTTKINGDEIECYTYSKNSDFVIINARNLEDGNTALYLYDTVNNTAIRYDETFINETNETIKNYTYIIIAFASTSLLMLVIIICLLHSSSKKQKKINKFIERQEAKIEATRKLNDVVAEVQKITSAENQNVSPKSKSSSKKNKKEDAIEIKEIQTSDPNNEIKKVLDDSEEVYDLFGDDKKKKKKK